MDSFLGAWISLEKVLKQWKNLPEVNPFSFNNVLRLQMKLNDKYLYYHKALLKTLVFGLAYLERPLDLKHNCY